MSDASPDCDLGPSRPLRDIEAALIRKLISGTLFESEILRRLPGALVRDMLDGGMGSIQFCKAAANKRVFGKEIAEGLFRDADGVPVSVTLNLDQNGDLFELDLWKVDFSRLISHPEIDDFEVIRRHQEAGL